MTVTIEDHAIRRDAERRLAELLKHRARLDVAYRYDPDPEIRAELDDLDAQIRVCKRTLAEYCDSCGHRLLLANAAETCCWSACAQYGALR